jgi:hypothetical protein
MSQRSTSRTGEGLSGLRSSFGKNTRGVVHLDEADLRFRGACLDPPGSYPQWLVCICVFDQAVVMARSIGSGRWQKIKAPR